MKNQNKNVGFEKLENRICLTVSAAMSGAGMLSVTGLADGEVQIVGSDAGMDVFDSGQLVDSFSNVENINILLDMQSGRTSDDVVRVILNSQSVDRVFAFLGQGNNIFDVSGDASVGRVIFVGGVNTDIVNVNVATDTAVMAVLRGGDDSISIAADSGWLFIDGGEGADTLTVAANSTVSGVSARLGNGDNVVDLQGDVIRRAGFMGGNGNDTFVVADTASIGNRLIMKAGDGDNTMNVQGTVGDGVTIRSGNGIQDVDVNSASIVGKVSIVLGDSVGNDRFERGGGIGNNVFVRGNIDGDVFIRTGNGDDTVDLTATISGNTSVLFGDGTNTFLHFGSTGGDLTVLSLNPDDVFVANGTVGGVTTLDPGGQNESRGFVWSWGLLPGSGRGWFRT